LIVAQNRKSSSLARAPGNTGRDEITILMSMLDLGSTITYQSRYTVEKLTFAVDRSAKIESALNTTETPAGNECFTHRYGCRTLAHHGNQPSRSGLAVDGG